MSKESDLWEEFLALKPNSKDLADVVRHCKSFRDKAGQMLCDWHPNHAKEDDLHPVIMFCAPELKRLATNRLLAVAGISRIGLRCIISNVPEFKTEAANRLMVGDHLQEDLDFIAEKVPELRDEAIRRKIRPMDVVFEEMKAL